MSSTAKAKEIGVIGIVAKPKIATFITNSAGISEGSVSRVSAADSTARDETKMMDFLNRGFLSNEILKRKEPATPKIMNIPALRELPTAE